MRLDRSFVVVSLCLAAGLAGVLAGERRADAAAEGVSVTKASATAVAIVDLERVMNGLNEKKKREDDMRTLIGQRQVTLDDLKKQLDGLSKQLELTPKEDRAKMREIKQRQIEIAATAEARKQALQTLIALETGEILREIYLKINLSITKVAGKDGWDLVLLDNRSIAIPEALTDREINFIIQSRTVLHATNSVDISDDIITLMNAEFGK